MSRTPGKQLQRLLCPRRIAFVGGREADLAARRCLQLGFAGEVWPVHPSRDQMAGVPCLSSLSELPGVPDAAFLAVPPTTTVDVVGVLSALGCGGVVIHTSGFAEVGPAGHSLQAELLEAAAVMPFLGPNCWGFLNYADRVALWPDLFSGEGSERGIALISQSGNLAITLGMQDRSLRIAYLLSVGNQAQTTESDLIEALGEDPRVSAIGLLLEGLTDVGRFDTAVRGARERGVPVVVLKTGRSHLGAGVNLSHTATLSGDDECYQALFRRLGVAVARTQTEFLETLKLLDVVGPLAGPRLLSMSCSGGEAALMADLAEPLGLVFPPFEAGRAERLRRRARLQSTPGNPFDYHTYIWGDGPAARALFAEAVQLDTDVAALVLDLPTGNGGPPPGDWNTIARVFAEVVNAVPHLGGVILSGLPEGLGSDFRRTCIERGIAPLQGMGDGLQAIAHAAFIGACWAGRMPLPLSANGLAARMPSGAARSVDEITAKRVLMMNGITIPDGIGVSAQEAPATAAAIGFPVVVKAVRADLLHKSEAGAVAVGLQDEAAVAAAVAGMSAISQLFLVESCVTGAVAELMVGVRVDMQFGLVLVIGTGGIWVEMLADSRTLLLPTDEQTVSRSLETLRIAPLFGGFRGGPAVDKVAVVEAILRVAEYAEQNADRLLELDVNPLMLTANGPVAADALIVFRR